MKFHLVDFFCCCSLKTGHIIISDFISILNHITAVISRFFCLEQKHVFVICEI